MEEIQFWSLIVASGGVIIAMVAAMVQAFQIRKQMSLTVFTDYTKRYQEIILKFPENINDKDFSFKGMEMDDINNVLRYMRAYFDLCSEEYYLSKKKRITPDIWEDWESGIIYAFSKPAFQQAWKKINFDTKYYPNFVNWVNEKALLKDNE